MKSNIGQGRQGHVNRAPAPMQQFRRVVAPVLDAQKGLPDRCDMRQNGRATEVVMPVVKGYGLSIAQALVVRHPQGDVTILEVCSPEGLRDMGATGVSVEVRNNLNRGDHYERVSIYKMWTGVAFQRWGFEGLNERVGPVTSYFPDIRRASPAALEKLSRFTGLRFAVNLQIRWREYHRIEDTRYALRNTGAHALSVFNAQDMTLMNQTMTQVADVAWGTEVQVARELMAMQIASEGVQIDRTSPTLGMATDIDAPKRDVNVTTTAPVAFVQKEAAYATV